MIPLIHPSSYRAPVRRKRILFVCSGNASRSQMAEGWARALFGDQVEPYSAGIEAHGLDPNAVLVMAEEGIDISRHQTKELSSLGHLRFDLIVTLSDRAANHLRHMPASQTVIHLPLLSPARRMLIGDTPLPHYRALRDELRDAVSRLTLGQASYRKQSVAV